MTGVLTGFATIALVIGVGWLLAHLGVLDKRSQLSLAKLTFYIGSPALMITMIGSAKVEGLFSGNLVASVAGVVVTAVICGLTSVLIFRRKAEDTVIGIFCSSYVNAGNLGIPIAAYAIGDPAVLAPMLLVQIVILQPAGLAALDVLSARDFAGMTRARVAHTAILRPLRNPITVGAVIGVTLALTGWRLPPVIYGPIELLAGLAIPCMLIGYGISLRTGPLPGRGERPAQLATITALKLIVQPLVAWLVAAYALGLTGTDLLAVVVIAALPTAQNVFVIAVRYNAGTILARDSVFLTTVLSVPAIIVITALLT